MGLPVRASDTVPLISTAREDKVHSSIAAKAMVCLAAANNSVNFTSILPLIWPKKFTKSCGLLLEDA
jgi:hypothetical protein